MSLPAPDMMSGSAGELLLRVRGLAVYFGTRAALRGVDFDLYAGETLGLVGESGSGKSTLARAVLGLIGVARGTVEWCGRDLLSCGAAELRRQRRDLQIVFQDPLASLDPRMTVGETIAEPLRIFEPALDADGRSRRVADMLERVGIGGGMSRRYPHEFSGGQCQRIGIARAMILRPRLLICDEPVSSLDVSIQGQIVNLLLDLQRDAGTAMLFISHNLAIVRHLSHRILVIYSGSLVEVAAQEALFAAPVHPYTRALLAAVPSPEQRIAARASAWESTAKPLPANQPSANTIEQQSAAGRSASLQAETVGCTFRERCGYALQICAAVVPPLEEVQAGRWVACHRAKELLSTPGQ